MRVLSSPQHDLVREERALLLRLRSVLARVDTSPEQQDALDRSIEQIDELFLLVVVGEFNAGKSAFINALVGQPLLKEGVTPTTAVITVLEYGEATEQVMRQPKLLAMKAPAEILREIRIVDTPGTNTIIREHETVTAEFVPRSDLVFFVTSADRPFSETEREFMEQIRGWGKKIVIVVNKSDILEDPRQQNEIRSFVSDNARRYLGFEPEIFFVSSKLALRAKQGNPSLWASSGFEPLERYVSSTLNESGRTELKLLNPLGVAAAVAERQITNIRDRQALLKDDFSTLEQVEDQLQIYQLDLERDFELRIADVEKVLLELERRGHRFFDDTMRIGRVMDLLNRSRVQEGFERQVMADAPQQIERKVGELIDWLIDADLRQWQAITAHLSKRRHQYAGQLVDNPTSERFHLDRRRMIDSVGRDAQRVVDTYDRQREASELADGARNAVATAAAVGAGALGLGAIVTIAASTAAADVTGIVMASVLAAIGFFVIPAKRSKAKEEMREKIAEVRQRLGEALRGQFTNEIVRSGERIRNSMAPYSRFIRSEGEKLISRTRAHRRARRHRVAAEPHRDREGALSPYTDSPERSLNSPVLSPSFSACTPRRFSIVSCRLVSGVCSGYTRWRPPLSMPEPPPTSSVGSGPWLWRSLLLMAAP
jgi:small GTP-binding protein